MRVTFWPPAPGDASPSDVPSEQVGMGDKVLHPTELKTVWLFLFSPPSQNILTWGGGVHPLDIGAANHYSDWFPNTCTSSRDTDSD